MHLIIGDLNNNGVIDVVWINVNGISSVYFGKKNNNNFINVKLPKTAMFSNAKVVLDNSEKKLYY